MAIAKRLLLFFAVNLLVILTINITLNVLGVRPYLQQGGLDYEQLLYFCAVVGFSGAFISLLMSKFMAKWMMGVKVIDPRNPASPEARWLVETVHRMSQKAGISRMPEVGVYESPEVNAFATGPTKNSALVAVSTGLMNHMNREEVEGVLGHEVSHAANGDMVTMTLIQGIINTFVMFFARVAAWVVSNALRGDRDRDGGPSHIVYGITVFLFEIFFSILGFIVVAAFSRWREFRADAGSAQIAGKEKMISALQSLQRYKDAIEVEHQALATFKINGRRKSGFLALMSTHPPLEDRIAALKRNRF